MVVGEEDVVDLVEEEVSYLFCLCSLRLSQQYFHYVGMGLAGLNQY